MLPRGGVTEVVSRDSLRGGKGSTGGRSRVGGFALPIACVIQKDTPLRCGFAGWLHFSGNVGKLPHCRSFLVVGTVKRAALLRTATCAITFSERSRSRRA